MRIEEKRLEPIWNFREISLPPHQLLILRYLETMLITANGKFLGKFLLLMMVILRKKNILRCLVILVYQSFVSLFLC